MNANTGRRDAAEEQSTVRTQEDGSAAGSAAEHPPAQEARVQGDHRAIDGGSDAENLQALGERRGDVAHQKRAEGGQKNAERRRPSEMTRRAMSATRKQVSTSKPSWKSIAPM